MLIPRQMNRPKRALTSMCMEVIYVSLAWSFPSPCFGRLCSHVEVALAWLLHKSHLDLEGSRYRALRLETLHRLFFMKFCKEFLKKTVLKNDCSKFSRSKRSVAKLSLLLYCLRDGENNLPSTPFKIYTEFNNKCACTKETAARNLCNERLEVLC